MMNQTLHERVFLVYQHYDRLKHQQRSYIDPLQTRAFHSRADALDYQEQMNSVGLEGRFRLTEIELI